VHTACILQGKLARKQANRLSLTLSGYSQLVEERMMPKAATNVDE
jgi:hypothetical protein